MTGHDLRSTKEDMNSVPMHRAFTQSEGWRPRDLLIVIGRVAFPFVPFLFCLTTFCERETLLPSLAECRVTTGAGGIDGEKESPLRADRGVASICTI